MLKFTSFLLWTCGAILFDGCLSAKTSNDEKQVDVQATLQNVRERMDKAQLLRSDDSRDMHPTLVAVSTAQSVDMIVKACAAGQKHFGESNINELYSKATNNKVRKNCPEIKWHFIGRLAINNQLMKLVSVPNLHVIETIDSRRMATAVEKAAVRKGLKKKLQIFAQVNPNKAEPTAFVKHVIDECPHLKFSGLMVLGKTKYDAASGPNPEFLKLVEFKKAVCKNLNLQSAHVQLSMGMTNDFEKAIEIGSDNVRVGTAIFGERKY